MKKPLVIQSYTDAEFMASLKEMEKTLGKESLDAWKGSIRCHILYLACTDLSLAVQRSIVGTITKMLDEKLEKK